MKKLRTCSGLNLHSYSKEALADYIGVGLEFHKENGFDAADIGMGLFDLTPEGWKPQVERAGEKADEIGIRFELCHLPFLGGNPQSNEALLEAFARKMHCAIDAAAALHVDFAVLHPSTAPLSMKKYDRGEQRDFVLRHLSPFAEHAAQAGVSLAVENMRILPSVMATHRYCQEPDELCEVADALGMSVCWDFGHANTVGFKQSEALSYIGKRLKVLHVNDNDGIEDEHLPPFMGNVNWRDAMHGLALAEFDGLFNYEVLAGKLPSALRKTYARYLAESAETLISYIE